MPIDLKSLVTLLGDRILIRPFTRPERRGGLYLARTPEKVQQTDVWWGTIESLGRDARYPDAYGLKVGDVVAIEALGRQCETLNGEDGEEHCWVAEEFLAARSTGRYESFHASEKWRRLDYGIVPLGQYVLVRPDAEEEKRGGVFIPHSSREAQKQGEVLAVSPGEVLGDILAPLHVEAGSRVLYGRYSGAWLKADEEVLLMKQENVIGVMAAVKAEAVAS